MVQCSQILLLLVVLSLPLKMYGQNVVRDVEYGSLPGQKLDIYPAQFKGSPIVILIHGGAWYGGSKSELSDLALYLQARGYAVASIDYRVTWQATFPANIEDVACATAYVVNSASTFNGDLDRVALLGQSAGAHLAALFALTGSTYLQCSHQAEIAIDAVIGVSGIYSFEHRNRAEPDRLLQMLGDSAKYYTEAEPIAQLEHAAGHNFLLLTSRVDHIVSPFNTIVFYDSLIGRGASADLGIFYEKDHVNMLSTVTDEDSVISRIRHYLDTLWPEQSSRDTLAGYDFDIRFEGREVAVQAAYDAQLYVHDVLGRIVAWFDIERGASRQRIWDVPRGIYFLKIVAEEGSSAVKVILE